MANSLEALMEELRRGDHIVTSRKRGLYDHHGIYEGNDRVIHFQGPLKGLKAPLTDFQSPLKDSLAHRDTACENCGYVHPKEGGLVRSCLECFHGHESLSIIRYRQRIPWEMNLDSIWETLSPGKVIYGYRSKKIYLELFRSDEELHGHLNISEKESLKYDFKCLVQLSRLSCSRSAEEVIRTANGEFGQYNFMFNNCEDFAVYCKTGIARSLQVEKNFKRIIGIPVIGKLCYKTIKCVKEYVDRQKKKKRLHEYLANR